MEEIEIDLTRSPPPTCARHDLCRGETGELTILRLGLTTRSGTSRV
jgi:hypothetical protein